MKTKEEQRKDEQMSRGSAITKWNQSRKRTITEPILHIGGPAAQLQNTEKENKSTAEIKQK